jgi:hypothetical protein
VAPVSGRTLDESSMSPFAAPTRQRTALFRGAFLVRYNGVSALVLEASRRRRGGGVYDGGDDSGALCRRKSNNSTENPGGRHVVP